ncbi:hypothetical protein KXQ82_03480 [Mucilaginibacter sp. HMF5004]|uniref:phospholipase D-like domain-containing protein n=1 Tax=Mucilaginibacter rivuli TaxID=2857527 RepID=UPI001C5FB053|nr:phospholipase D-like domain-containing protein [Mucilaginibacter rivuli]MBW4888755.1 hypothetical protein [Mucilaginibacter rivuli]
MKVFQSKNGVCLTAYQGDAMTLLGFDIDKNKITNFSGFSIRVTQPGRSPYYLYNKLCYPATVTYAGVTATPNRITTEFSPIQKFRWVHVPATDHDINDPVFGDYTYAVTPRYLVNNVLQPIDPNNTVTVTIAVCPFRCNDLEIGFTRSYIASQAFVNNFGNEVNLRPKTGPDKNKIIFDTKQIAGTANRKVNGVTTPYQYTYDELHTWLGWQARARAFEFLQEAADDPNISMDVFAFDLDEPAACSMLLDFAAQGRLRMILDNSSTHIGNMSDGTPQYEDQFETLFKARATGNAKIVRGHFQALAHSKVFIQKKNGKAIKVLSGSTNFSTNGLYVNANNVLIFNNANVAALYENFFDASLLGMSTFKNSEWATKGFSFNRTGQPDNVDDAGVPDMIIRCSPHTKADATAELQGLADQVKNAKDNILFAIMEDESGSALLEEILRQVESDEKFTYGITDTSKKVYLYKPHSTKGIHVVGKGLAPKLPPPFNKEPGIPGISIHHKFVVLDFNTPDGVVFCGSSNLALGPEQHNGDNLLEIRDQHVVTAFAIEAIRLVDHFQFRDKDNTATKSDVPLVLHTDDQWVAKYYDDTDMHCRERTLLAKH